MAKSTTFDVLIVYSAKIAQSASQLSYSPLPFINGSVNASYNVVYSYFLDTCRKNNLSAAFTTSTDIVGAGRVGSYWLFKNKVWSKVHSPGFSHLIFDKFSPTRKKIKENRNLLFSSPKIHPFNTHSIFNLCFDKQQTYNKLHAFSIPTVSIQTPTQKSVNSALRQLLKMISLHPYASDFSGELILKDRFGSGGRNVYKFGYSQIADIVSTLRKHKNISFIIQPFVQFDKGFKFQGSLVPADIRLIYFGKRLIQTYIRMAKVGDFRCNEHRGGTLKYISKKSVPPKVRKLSDTISDVLNEKTSLIALDFIISNSGNIYLLEANTGPGLDWNLALKENEIEAKKLIRLIVKELAYRANPTATSPKRKAVKFPISTPIIADYPQMLIAV